jgi:hypothetical protein
MKQKYGYELDKRRVVAEMLKRFEGWREVKDLSPSTAERAEQLFKTSNAAFDVGGQWQLAGTTFKASDIGNARSRPRGRSQRRGPATDQNVTRRK